MLVAFWFRFVLFEEHFKHIVFLWNCVRINRRHFVFSFFVDLRIISRWEEVDLCQVYLFRIFLDTIIFLVLTVYRYAYFKKLDYFSTECIYSPNAYR